jgi:hypothetical protein
LTNGTGGIGSESISQNDPIEQIPRLLISALGFPGLALFQAEDWLTDLSYYRLDQMFGLVSEHQKSLLLAILGIPGSLCIIWLIGYCRKIYTREIFTLIISVTLIPILILTYISYKINFDLLSNFFGGSRYFLPGFIFLQIVLTNAFWIKFSSIKEQVRTFGRRLLIFTIIAFFVIIPNMFVIALYSKKYVLQNLTQAKYVTTRNQLYQPSLSTTNAQEAVNLINSIVQSKKDVVFIYEGIFTGTWLDIEHRILPLSAKPEYFASALTRARKSIPASAFSINSSLQFKSSQALRVIAIIPKTASDEVIIKLKAKVPQAKVWHSLPTNSTTRVDLWYTDLQPV